METDWKEYEYDSCGGGKVYAQSWAPVGTPVKGIVQIAHGMAEYSNRYADFAKYLCSRGYAVFINDHIGHGKSVSSRDDLGYFGEKDGWEILVKDVKALSDIAKKAYPQKPLIIFGHSMGSFIARSYSQKYGTDISAAIYCGTSGKNPAAGMGIKIAEFIAKRKGARYRSEFINSLAFGNYNKRIKDKRTDFDWLSTNTENVDKYVADPDCGYLFTAVGYKDLFSITKDVSSKMWYKNVPYILPILIISGSMDPVGNYGQGVRQVYDDLKKTGHKDVTMKIYEGLRHEILNETNREEVFDDVANWLDEKVGSVKTKEPAKTEVK